jgi:hypothetical protein
MIVVMKNKYGFDWLSVEDKNDVGMVKERLSDNGWWEYDRLGIGLNGERVFVVDLDDSGEEWREMVYCDKVKSVEEVLKIGVKYGVFEEDDGEYYVNEEYEEENEKKWKKKIGMIKDSGKLYSMFE